jgi:hypothetical protein
LQLHHDADVIEAIVLGRELFDNGSHTEERSVAVLQIESELHDRVDRSLRVRNEDRGVLADLVVGLDELIDRHAACGDPEALGGARGRHVVACAVGERGPDLLGSALRGFLSIVVDRSHV